MPLLGLDFTFSGTFNSHSSARSMEEADQFFYGARVLLWENQRGSVGKARREDLFHSLLLHFLCWGLANYGLWPNPSCCLFSYGLQAMNGLYIYKCLGGKTRRLWDMIITWNSNPLPIIKFYCTQLCSFLCIVVALAPQWRHWKVSTETSRPTNLLKYLLFGPLQKFTYP